MAGAILLRWFFKFRGICILGWTRLIGESMELFLPSFMTELFG